MASSTIKEPHHIPDYTTLTNRGTFTPTNSYVDVYTVASNVHFLKFTIISSGGGGSDAVVVAINNARTLSVYGPCMVDSGIYLVKAGDVISIKKDSAITSGSVQIHSFA